MGRQSREHRERREKKMSVPAPGRAAQLEEQLKEMKDGDAHFWSSDNCPAEMRETHLEDVIAFESVGSGTSLFEGLEQHGIDLPRPEKLDRTQCTAKIEQILNALAALHIMLVGYERMSPEEFYRTLWHETLWEGCYVKKRNPLALTIMDVSHSLQQSDVMRILEEMGLRRVQ